MKKLIVYMAHDRVNGKCYFGSTFQTLEKRIKQHIYYANKQENKGHFYNALKTRPDKFFWCVLFENFEDSRDKERELLKLYCGQPWCYNLKNTADGAGYGEYNCGKNEQTKQKRREKNKKKVEKGLHIFQNKEFKQNNSDFQKELIMKGDHNFTEKQGPGIRNAYANKALWKRYEKIYKIWLYYNKPKEYKLARILGLKRSSLKRMVDSFFKDIV